MATRYYVGTSHIRGKLENYAQRFDFAELVVSGQASDKPVGERTYKRWRKSVPASFQFAVVAAPALAALERGGAYTRGVAALQVAVDALQARCVVLRTPPSVRPTAPVRKALAEFFEAFPRDVTHVVWEPSGLWEIDDALSLGRVHRAIVAVDPLRDRVGAGQMAYVHLQSIGEQRTLTDTMVRRAQSALSQKREVFVLLDTTKPATDRKRWLQAAKNGDALDGGRLVRPRGGLLVMDDEQE
jgi:uncharacterized protein YecE (DUF72 family)